MVLNYGKYDDLEPVATLRLSGADHSQFAEEGSEATPINGDGRSERLASELGPGCQALEGTRNVNIESLYEVSRSLSRARRSPPPHAGFPWHMYLSRNRPNPVLTLMTL